MIIQRLIIGMLAGDIECAGCGAMAASGDDGMMRLAHDDLCPEFPGRLVSSLEIRWLTAGDDEGDDHGQAIESPEGGSR